MIKEIIFKVVSGNHLSEEEMINVMNEIMEGAASDAQIGAFLTALRMKGETIDELTGAARVMRAKAAKIKVDKEETIVDTCGTGGDGTNTFNISTVCAFVAAGGGLKVAKHGNRSVSSQCGSADVLSALGVKIDCTPKQVEECIRKIGIGFLYAPVFHDAMKYATPPRREIGIRTIFNLLGPLSNPAAANVQLLGVYDAALTLVMSEVLKKLGVVAALVVHGEGGFDEITITGSTRVSELKQSKIITYEICPEDFGLRRGALEDIIGGDASQNAKIIQSVLNGEKGPRRDIVLLNAGALFMAAEAAGDFKEGIAQAVRSIDSGAALKKLEQLIELTNYISKAQRHKGTEAQRHRGAENSILSRIVKYKKEEVRQLKRQLKIESLRAQLSDCPPPRRFKELITQGKRVNIIAEVKHASPITGVLAGDFNPVDIADDFLKGGAAALSILTEQEFFKGNLDFISLVKKKNSLPVLRKDFIIDSYQIYESRVCGADAILLIVSLLSENAVRDFLSLSSELDMDTLVEIHDEEELAVALNAGCDIIGINNRNLKTFKIDLTTTIKLVSCIPSEKVIVSESGIKNREDIIQMEEAGVKAVLIGEALMRARNRVAMLRELRGV
ncbi:MAG: Anthranilate phosphoribosyltransferase [Firmicutes bacterium]|nr:Anthranilate phosphoribosyltransferase [Bacillota bacterium]